MAIEIGFCTLKVAMCSNPNYSTFELNKTHSGRFTFSEGASLGSF